MDIVNAIARVRFSSARPQRVQLHRAGPVRVELICMEPGQQLSVPAGPRTYYVITGPATVQAGGGEPQAVGPGQMALLGAEESHVIANAGEQRLVCLAAGPAG